MRHQSWLFALGGGVLVFIGLLSSTLLPLVVVGTAGYFIALQLARTSWEALWCGALFGLCASAGGVWWFYDVLPLSWLAIPTNIAAWYLVSVGFGLTVLALAVPFALFAPLVRIVPKTAWGHVLVIAVLFVGIEELRMWSFALFFLAPGSPVPTDFSLAALGYVLLEHPVTLPLAQAGFMGLTLAFGLIAALIANSFYVRNAASLVVGGVVLVAALSISHNALPSLVAVKTTRVALLATTVPPGYTQDATSVLGLLPQAVNSGASIVVIPEGLGLMRFLPERERFALYHAVSERDILIISSSVLRGNADTTQRERILYESTKQGVLASQDKTVFVPIGEYLPPLVRMFVALVGDEALHAYTSYSARQFVPGTDTSSVAFDDLRIGTLQCSELVSPYLYHDLAQTRATTVLINIANHSWFHGSRLLNGRLRDIAKMHALYNRQWLLVAANDSPAYAVNPRGEIVGETTWDVPGVLIVDVPRTSAAL